MNPGYVCEYTGWPGIKWSSSTDLTSTFPGISCARLETPLPDTSGRAYKNWWDIARLIESEL